MKRGGGGGGGQLGQAPEGNRWKQLEVRQACMHAARNTMQCRRLAVSPSHVANTAGWSAPASASSSTPSSPAAHLEADADLLVCRHQPCQQLLKLRLLISRQHKVQGEPPPGKHRLRGCRQQPAAPRAAAVRVPGPGRRPAGPGPTAAEGRAALAPAAAAAATARAAAAAPPAPAAAAGLDTAAVTAAPAGFWEETGEEDPGCQPNCCAWSDATATAAGATASPASCGQSPTVGLWLALSWLLLIGREA